MKKKPGDKKDINKKTLRNLFVNMLRIRRAQEKIAEIFPQEPRKMRCPIHLYIGQEAIAAGVCENLTSRDYVFSFYRGHGHYLLKGGSMKGLFAELYGKETGCSKGRGGSMHLIDVKNGFMGTSAIVGGQIPMAVGAALGFKMKNEERISVVFFGDGACEEGVWHESMNFAALKKLPVLFVCENNLYAVKSPIFARQSADNIYKKAESYGMKSRRIDGNNVTEVFSTAKQLIDLCRKGKGPAFIEARTYRWRGHLENTFFSKDILEGRSKKEVDEWQKRCPVGVYKSVLLKKEIFKESDLKQIENKVKNEIKEAVQFAERSPFPNVKKFIKMSGSLI